MTPTSDLFSSGGVQIQLKGLQKHYQTAAGEVSVLSGIDLSIEPGKAWAIMGRSGCGKTTLLNLIGGIDHPSAGTIHYDGQDITRFSERALEEYRLSRVGFVFQLFNLIPSLTALDNVMLPMVLAEIPESKRRARALELLEQMGMAAKADKFPDQLSGGEQQRVAITVALANDPPLILADEPTGNLDSKNAEGVADLLCALARQYGKTVVIVSHDPHIPPKADHTLVMEDGRFQAV
ncbi:MAG: ABC transporter ATP-binding protein [Acidobacteria bacterium]|nr:ABC transporter ATP-binding protein [Acidobacteriota bacterium]